jgi:hypothetical protein
MGSASVYVERHNLTMRMGMRRFTRLTNGFSKKLDNHMAMVAIHAVYYNYGRIHKSLRITPSMAAGLSDHVWSLEEIVMMADNYMPQPAKRGPYKKRISSVEGKVMKKATTFLFAVLNGTWVLIAYLLYRNGVRPTLIVTVAAIGVLLGNVALYAGVWFAKKLLRKSG